MKPTYRWFEEQQAWVLLHPENVRLDSNFPLKVWPAANVWLMPTGRSK